MRSRGVTADDVALALSRPIGDPHAGETGSLWIEGLAVGGRILRVCLDAADARRVITVAWKES